MGRSEYPRRIPTLVELCVRTAINNLRYMGDVGEVDLYLLKDILPHCNVDQLTHIENSTEGRDLSPVTNDLWKRFYEQHFGVESANTVIKRMKQKKVVYKWRLLYEAKMKEREQAQVEIAEKLKQSYAESQARNGSTSGSSNAKGNLMKKAKLEYLNCHETKVHAIMRRNATQQKNMPQESVPRPVRPNNFGQSNSASSSRNVKPVARR